MKKKKRILIIGDSLAMPRPGVSYENTWVYKLIEALSEIEFIDKTRRASTTERLVSEGEEDRNTKGADLLEHYKPDIVVMQIGIVDCAPRYFKKGSFEYIILNKIMPKNIRTRYVDFVKKNRIRDPKKAYVLPYKFRLNCIDYFQRAKFLKIKVIVILIAPVTDVFVDKSPYINKSIENYNDIYRSLGKDYENVYLLQPFDDGINIGNITIDGYHVNSKGHNVIFQKLMDQICPK